MSFSVAIEIFYGRLASLWFTLFPNDLETSKIRDAPASPLIIQVQGLVMSWKLTLQLIRHTHIHTYTYTHAQPWVYNNMRMHLMELAVHCNMDHADSSPAVALWNACKCSSCTAAALSQLTCTAPLRIAPWLLYVHDVAPIIDRNASLLCILNHIALYRDIYIYIYILYQQFCSHENK